MIEKNNVEIVEVYHEGLASPLAEMFNSWDELWPGGFLDGVPYTAERVHRWLNPMRAISILIAMEQGKPVGFLPLHSLWRDPEAAYVGLLGVSPDVVGKKVGKRLLLRSMAIAAQQGYRRVDLYTWAGNLSAVPLYKKAGFMWNPDTEGVYMQSYIPAILNHPLCIPFFERHPDETAWYDLQRRYLTQIPDEMTQKGMDVFIYTFEGGEDLLRVSVDRYARAITGVERVLDGKRLRIDAGVAGHLTLCGLPKAYCLELENGTDEDLVLSLSMEGFEGLHFEGEPQSLLKAPAGKSVTWTVPFRLDTSAPLYRKELKSPAITATLKTDEQGFTLATGMKIKSAAEIHTQFGECRVVPGETGSVRQMRETSAELTRLAKAHKMTTFLVGHITKGGAFAGPKTMEHLVDVAIYLEGSREEDVRILRSVKNRFGATNEIAVFQMQSGGLKAITDPSRFFLDEHNLESRAGTVVVSIIEGTSPILVELQALVSPTGGYGAPHRLAAVLP